MTDINQASCESCRACCKGQLVTLEAGDDPAAYEVDTLTGPRGVIHLLKHKPNGDCIYLGPDGCTIHGRHPIVCRAFDCVAFAEEWPRARRRAAGVDRRQDEVLKAGIKRLHARRQACRP